MTKRPYAEVKAQNRELSRLDQEEHPEQCRALPVKVTLNNTHKCNIACPLCFKQFEPGHNMSYPDMPIEVYRAVAEDLFPTADEVALSVSGEPLISGNIEEELALGAEYGVDMVITTNGMPLANSRLRGLALRHLAVVHLSMDAVAEDTFERIRAGANYRKVIDGLESLLREREVTGVGPRIYVNFVMMRENIEELPLWVDRMAALGVDGCFAEHVVVPAAYAVQSLVSHRRLANEKMAAAGAAAEKCGMPLRLPPFFPLGPDEDRDPPMSREEAREMIAGGGESSPAATSTEEAAHIPTPEEITAWNSRIQPGDPVKCPYLWRELWVFHDGGINCCDTPTFPHRMGEVPGDLCRDVWNGEKFQDLRRRLVSGEVFAACRHCHVMGQIDKPEDPQSFVKDS